MAKKKSWTSPQFVIVCGDAIEGPYESYAAAILAGRARCGDDSFGVLRLEPDTSLDNSEGGRLSRRLQRRLGGGDAG